MSNIDMNSSGKGNVKTLAIRLEPDLHAQLSVIAQLGGTTITDEIREAIATHVESKRSAPELAAKANAVLEEIDREADVRRDAIAALSGSPGSPGSGDAPAEPAPRTRGRKSPPPKDDASTS